MSVPNKSGTQPVNWIQPTTRCIVGIAWNWLLINWAKNLTYSTNVGAGIPSEPPFFMPESVSEIHDQMQK